MKGRISKGGNEKFLECAAGVKFFASVGLFSVSMLLFVCLTPICGRLLSMYFKVLCSCFPWFLLNKTCLQMELLGWKASPVVVDFPEEKNEQAVHETM